MEKRIALFPGSFDPITLGHYDIVKRAIPLFDKIVIGIGTNVSKKYMFSIEKRVEFIKEAFKEYDTVEVTPYEGLTVDFCDEIGAQFILRGLRNPADFEFEKAIAHANRKMNNKIEMVFLLTSSGKSYISSSIVRDVMKNGGDYTGFVPDSVRI
ncbi:pantetheine-phosphate adenylyltransferase [Flavobacteriaceae bacterium UJ101]|nr:pantetheine-phosphate adenylyltransferase [Flavobacteriaceae bacterium UJ101]